MQFLTSLSSSEMLVSVAFTLFAVLVISSVCLRLRNKSRERKSVPDTVAKHGFRLFMGADTDRPQVQIPDENFDKIYPARPKVRENHSAPLLNADEVTLEGDALIEEIMTQSNTSEQVAHADWSDSDRHSTDGGYENFKGESAWVAEGQPAVATTTLNGYSDYAVDQYEQSTPETAATASNRAAISNSEYEVSQYEDTTGGNDDWHDNANEQWQDSGAYQSGYESGPQNNDGAFDTTYQSNESDTAYESTRDDVNNEHVRNDVYEDANVGEDRSSDLADAPNLRHLAHEVQRVGSSQHEEERPNLSVVSICLVSNFENRIFRDVSGDRLASFLNNRGFIFLDGEYHLKSSVTRDCGTVRVRNLEPMPIGDLVRNNDFTRGFRMYFRPAEDPNPLATLNEMLKISQSAAGYFVDVGSLPLQIYHGLQKIKLLTQEDYEQLQADLRSAFPRPNPATSPSRTQMSYGDYNIGNQLASEASA